MYYLKEVIILLVKNLFALYAIMFICIITIINLLYFTTVALTVKILK